MQDDFDFIRWSWTILLAPITWVATIVFKQTNALAKHKQHVAENYTPKREFNILDERIFRILERIETKIDQKVDK